METLGKRGNREFKSSYPKNKKNAAIAGRLFATSSFNTKGMHWVDINYFKKKVDYISGHLFALYLTLMETFYIIYK